MAAHPTTQAPPVSALSVKRFTEAPAEVLGCEAAGGRPQCQTDFPVCCATASRTYCFNSRSVGAYTSRMSMPRRYLRVNLPDAGVFVERQIRDLPAVHQRLLLTSGEPALERHSPTCHAIPPARTPQCMGVVRIALDSRSRAELRREDHPCVAYQSCAFWVSDDQWIRNSSSVLPTRTPNRRMKSRYPREGWFVSRETTRALPMK